jgi:hypothetical protein
LQKCIVEINKYLDEPVSSHMRMLGDAYCEGFFQTEQLQPTTMPKTIVYAEDSALTSLG